MTETREAMTLPEGWEQLGRPNRLRYRVDPGGDAPIVYALPGGVVEAADYQMIPEEARLLAARLLEAADLAEALLMLANAQHDADHPDEGERP